MQDRKGGWIQTYTGGKFWPLDPRPEEVKIEDIAHALSMLCRYGGHCRRFYSVAEHSVIVSYYVPWEYALTALLHDAPEAYITDLPRPLKYSLDGYQEAEDRVWRAVADHFGLHHELPDSVKWADDAILYHEVHQNMTTTDMDDRWWDRGKILPYPQPILELLDPVRAEQLFLSRFHEIVGGSPCSAEESSSQET